MNIRLNTTNSRLVSNIGHPVCDTIMPPTHDEQFSKFGPYGNKYHYANGKSSLKMALPPKETLFAIFSTG
ncbi:hypothetical protein LQW54_004413 [Pestalotiopsis sp. IQ-011]